MAERQVRAAVRAAALGAGVAVAMAGAVFLAPAAAAADEAPSTGFRATVLDLGGLQLNVRADATFAGTVVGTVDSGATIRIGCQTTGPRVVNGMAGYVSTTWDYLPDLGGYVSDAWVYTGVDGRIAGVPDCGSAERGPANKPAVPKGAAPAARPVVPKRAAPASTPVVRKGTGPADRPAAQKGAAPAARPEAPAGAAPSAATGDHTAAARSAAQRAAAILAGAWDDNDRNHNGIPDDEEYGGNGGFTPNGF